MTNSHEAPQECESCNETEGLRYRFNLWLCEKCMQNEIKARLESGDIKSIQAEVQQSIARVDTQINVRTDIFNATVQSIEELKNEIGEVENKNFVLAERLQARINEYKRIVFNLNEQVLQESNKQRATQEYLNNLANKLRAEERERLRLQDISYKPKPVTKPIKTSAVKKSTKFDKAGLKQLALELGMAEFTIQSMIVAKGWTLEQAGNELRRIIKESKSETES